MAPTNMPAVSIDINMFWQIINFFILVFIFNKYFKAPLLRLMDSRKEKIAAEFSEAQKNKEEAALKNKEAQQILKQAKDEATKIVQLAEKKADERKENIISEASIQRDKMLKSAELEI
ncbi:MAG: F0F1 ATP synthase subunit B, partial [Cetobacterium sp.]